MKYSAISFVLAASVALAVAIEAPLVRAETSEPHILIAQVWMGNSWGTILSQEFSSRERCEAAAKVVSDMKGSQNVYCLPK